MLYEGFKEDCQLYERTRVPDGDGGWSAAWVPSVAFRAAIVLDSSMSARRAEAEGVASVYTVTTDHNAELVFHDAFKRLRDGKTFRITKVNDPTPGMASFKFNQYQAEEWELSQ